MKTLTVELVCKKWYWNNGMKEKKQKLQEIVKDSEGRKQERGKNIATDLLSLLQQSVTPANAHFCDYATGARVLAANHKNDTGRCKNTNL